MKAYIFMVFLLTPGFANAKYNVDYNIDTCMDANIKSQKLKKQLIQSTKRIQTSELISNSGLLLEQLKQLNNDLSAARDLIKLSEEMLIHCENIYPFKGIYDISDKKKTFESYYKLSPDREAFYYKYIVTNQTLTDAITALKQDILIKTEELKTAIKSGLEKELNKEKETNKKLIEEKKELDELQELINQKNLIQQKNQEIKVSIEKTKNTSISDSNKKTAQISIYTDRMASYAAVIGRATACGANPKTALSKVGAWMDRWFSQLNISSKMQSTYLTIFMQGTEFHMNQQQVGNTPDSCNSALNTFNSIRWP
jgi:hypothetical protein